VPKTGVVGIPEEAVVDRPPLPGDRRAALIGLADVITTDTVRDVLSIVTKTHFRFDGGADFVWETMSAIAHDCPDPAVRDQVLDLRRYFTLERSV
jgi:hypothetical protein